MSLKYQEALDFIESTPELTEISLNIRKLTALEVSEIFIKLSAKSTALVKLEIYGTPINYKVSHALEDHLFNCPSLKILIIQDASLNTSGAKSLSNALCGYENLEILKLRNNQLNYHSAAIISKKINQMERMKVLDLSQNQLSNLSDEYILEDLNNTVNLLKNDIDNFAKSFNDSYLEEIWLENTQLNDYALLQLFSSTLNSRTLKSLHLSMNKIEFGEMFCFENDSDLSNSYSSDEEDSPQKRECSLIEKIDLSWNCIHAKGTAILAEFLVNFTMVKDLDLSGNSLMLSHDSFCGDGFVKLFKSNTIESLSLNSLSLPTFEKGADYFCVAFQSLSNNRKLKKLEFSHNPIDKSSLWSDLFRSIKANVTLQILSIEQNSLTIHNLIFLLKAWQKNHTLMEVNFKANGLGVLSVGIDLKMMRQEEADAAQAILTSLDKIKRNIILDLRGHNLSLELESQLASFLERPDQTHLKVSGIKSLEKIKSELKSFEEIHENAKKELSHGMKVPFFTFPSSSSKIKHRSRNKKKLLENSHFNSANYSCSEIPSFDCTFINVRNALVGKIRSHITSTEQDSCSISSSDRQHQLLCEIENIHTMPDLLDCMEQPFCQNLDTEPFIQMAFSAMHDIIEGEVSYRLFSNDEIKTYLLKWREQFNSDEKQPLFRF